MKKIVQILGFVSFLFLLLTSCSSSEKKSEAKEEKKETSKKSSILDEYDLTTQVGFEKMLSDYKIPIPQNSTLKEVVMNKEKNYTIVYNVKYFEGFIDSLQTQYEKFFDSSFLEKGWKKPISGWIAMGTLYFDPQMKYHLKFTIASYPGSDIHQVIFEYGKY